MSRCRGKQNQQENEDLRKRYQLCVLVLGVFFLPLVNEAEEHWVLLGRLEGAHLLITMESYGEVHANSTGGRS